MKERHPLTPGKARGLATTSTPEGAFTMLAVDHRDALRAVLAPGDPAGVTAADLTAIKLEVLGAVGSESSAVLLDPEYSAAQAIATGALPGTIGFLAAVEAQGYLGDPTARRTTLLDGWSVAKAKRLGASGIKLLVLYHPAGGAVTESQDLLISEVVADCARHDIPLFLEPLAYAVDPAAPVGSPAFAARRRAVVVETVERLGALGPDVLKVQFPVDTEHEPDRGVWADACAELDAASPVPWALLSGGDRYELFRDQVQVACRAGASGFMVGRALWGEYVTASPEERPRLSAEVLRPRFHELRTVAVQHARSWRSRCAMPTIGDRWYTDY